MIDMEKIRIIMDQEFKRLSNQKTEIIKKPLQWSEYLPSDKTIVKRDWASLLKDMDWTRGASSRVILFQRIVGPLLIELILQFKPSGPYEPLYSVVNLAYPCNERPSPWGNNNKDFSNSRWSSNFRDPYSRIRPGDHKEKYLGAFEYLKKIAYIPVEGPVTLDDILHGYKVMAKDIYIGRTTRNTNYEAYIDDKELDVGILPFAYAGTPALVAAWAGEIEKAREYLDWGCEVVDEDKEPLGTKAEFKKFHEKLIENPEALRKLVEDNITTGGGGGEYIPKYLCQAPYQDIVGVRYKKLNNLKK